MQVTQTIASEDDIDSLLTRCELTMPALLSVATGLAIYCERLEVRVGDVLEARSETLIPRNAVRIIERDARIDEMKKGVQLLGVSCSSPRFTLASTYFREALYFNSAYNEHNPYTHSLVTILKCAQAIEVLFGSKYDSVREKCRKLGIADEVIESEIVRINVTRNKLGVAHASGFVPTPSQADILREFAQRAVQSVQHILLLISKAKISDHAYLVEKLHRDPDKDKLIESLHKTLQQPLWCNEGKVRWRHVSINDPRLGGSSSVVPIPSADDVQD